MKTVLLVGGAGYIGSHTAKFLAQKGYRPVAVDNLVHGHREAVKWGPLEEGDIGDELFLRGVFARHAPSAVIHFAAYAYVGESVSDPAKYYRNNVAGTLTLLDAAREAGVNRLVFSSTCATYGVPESVPILESAPQRPINPYGWSKLMMERVLADYGAAYGLRSVCLRYFNAAGADPDGELGEEHDPETHLIPLVLAAAAGRNPGVSVYGGDYPTPDGTCVRDYIHVTDLAQAHWRALEYLEAGGAGDVFNLGNGSGYSVREVVEAARRITGRPVPMTIGPRRPGDPAALVGGAEKAARVLGWKPAYASLDAILATAWAWHARRWSVGGA